MPLEPKPTSLQADSLAASAIENEIPAYRAIAASAVVALILGVASILCFVELVFPAARRTGSLVGFTADRKIQRFPDLFVGRGMAQAGLGLGLVFGLTAVTIGTAQSFLLAKQAKDFGRAFARCWRKTRSSKSSGGDSDRKCGQQHSREARRRHDQFATERGSV